MTDAPTDAARSVRGRGEAAARSEQRQPALRIAEILGFPRASALEAPRTGIALDESASGLCLAVDGAIPRHVLLRIVLRDFDGRIARQAIGRVAWCEARAHGRFAIGLELIEETRDGAESDDGVTLAVQYAPRRAPVEVAGSD